MYRMHKIMLIYDIPMTCALKTVAVMQGHYKGNSCTCHGLCTLVLQRQVLMYSYAQTTEPHSFGREAYIYFIEYRLYIMLCSVVIIQYVLLV